MKRKLKIIDEENKIYCDIDLDEENEFLELWCMRIEEKPMVVVERKINPYKKPPFAIYPPSINN